MQRVFDAVHQPGFTLNEQARGWDDAVAPVAYQPLWPLRFATEARVLRESLSGLAPRIAHVGGTAVAGMASRPIIDIAVGLEQPARIAAFAERLCNFGYVPAEATPPGCERLFVRRVRGLRTHQVLLVRAGGRCWEALLAWRDHLREDPALAAEFAAVKLRLAAAAAAAQQTYRQAKTDFILGAMGAAVRPACPQAPVNAAA